MSLYGLSSKYGDRVQVLCTYAEAMKQRIINAKH